MTNDCIDCDDMLILWVNHLSFNCSPFVTDSKEELNGTMMVDDKPVFRGPVNVPLNIKLQMSVA